MFNTIILLALQLTLFPLIPFTWYEDVRQKCKQLERVKNQGSSRRSSEHHLIQCERPETSTDDFFKCSEVCLSRISPLSKITSSDSLQCYWRTGILIWSSARRFLAHRQLQDTWEIEQLSSRKILLNFNSHQNWNGKFRYSSLGVKNSQHRDNYAENSWVHALLGFRTTPILPSPSHVNYAVFSNIT